MDPERQTIAVETHDGASVHWDMYYGGYYARVGDRRTRVYPTSAAALRAANRETYTDAAYADLTALPNSGEYALPEGSKPVRCRSCGAQVVWIQTARKRRMPLRLDTARTIRGRRYAMTHFADCPDAGQWRKR